MFFSIPDMMHAHFDMQIRDSEQPGGFFEHEHRLFSVSLLSTSVCGLANCSSIDKFIPS